MTFRITYISKDLKDIVDAVKTSVAVFESEEITLTSATTSQVFDLLSVMDKFTWQVVADNNNFSIKLEGNIDGTNFFTLDEISSSANNSEMRHVAFKPVRYVRFNITSMGSATQIKIKFAGCR